MSDIHKKLRERYSGPEWTIAFEVPNSTGFGATRRCDAIAMGTWPSKGLYLHGHEIKVSRSDWLKEIDDPTKADAFYKRCHYWWIVAPKGIVKLAELPATWGLMHCTEKSALRVGKAATKLEPLAITYPFLASMLRAFNDSSDIQRKLKRADDEGYRRGYDYATRNAKSEHSYKLKQAERDLLRIKDDVKSFEETSGISIGGYDGRHMGEAVKLAKGLVGYNSVDKVVKNARDAMHTLDSLLKLLPEVMHD